jgi:hypothetical protein
MLIDTPDSPRPSRPSRPAPPLPMELPPKMVSIEIPPETPATEIVQIAPVPAKPVEIRQTLSASDVPAERVTQFSLFS